MYQIHVIRKLSWYQTLSFYFFFLSIAIKSVNLVAYPFPEKFTFDSEKVSKLTAKYPSLSKDLDLIFSKLNSPTLFFNPKFIESTRKLAEQLSSTESEAMKVIKFLKGLQDLGITDFSELTTQAKVVTEIYRRRDEIEAKLQKAEDASKKLEEKNS
jgi:hypothetical protein